MYICLEIGYTIIKEQGETCKMKGDKGNEKHRRN